MAATASSPSVGIRSKTSRISCSALHAPTCATVDAGVLQLELEAVPLEEGVPGRGLAVVDGRGGLHGLDRAADERDRGRRSPAGE